MALDDKNDTHYFLDINPDETERLQLGELVIGDWMGGKRVWAAERPPRTISFSPPVRYCYRRNVPKYKTHTKKTNKNTTPCRGPVWLQGKNIYQRLLGPTGRNCSSVCNLDGRRLYAAPWSRCTVLCWAGLAGSKLGRKDRCWMRNSSSYYKEELDKDSVISPLKIYDQLAVIWFVVSQAEGVGLGRARSRGLRLA